jgi:hypothetical protein
VLHDGRGRSTHYGLPGYMECPGNYANLRSLKRERNSYPRSLCLLEMSRKEKRDNHICRIYNNTKYSYNPTRNKRDYKVYSERELFFISPTHENS